MKLTANMIIQKLFELQYNTLCFAPLITTLKFYRNINHDVGVGNGKIEKKNNNNNFIILFIIILLLKIQHNNI